MKLDVNDDVCHTHLQLKVARMLFSDTKETSPPGTLTSVEEYLLNMTLLPCLTSIFTSSPTAKTSPIRASWIGFVAPELKNKPPAVFCSKTMC